jgi:NAD(P)-dependent dehydrogenase (short-subunit alcohol dehydrogenase family)
MVQPIDLTSLDSIRAAADELGTKHPRIDLLINNAGVMFTPKQTSRDGFELQFATPCCWVWSDALVVVGVVRWRRPVCRWAA